MCITKKAPKGIEVKDGIGSTRTELGEQKNLKNGDYIKKYIDEGTIPTNVESNIYLIKCHHCFLIIHHISKA